MENQTAPLWKPHAKFLYSALNKKQEELSQEEKKKLLLNPPVAIPEKVKKYLDCEAKWFQLNEMYYTRMKALSLIQKKRSEKAVAQTCYVSKRQKRKMSQQAPQHETRKKGRTANKDKSLSEDCLNKLSDKLEEKYKIPIQIVDEIGDKIDKECEPKYHETLKRNRTTGSAKSREAEVELILKEMETKVKREADVQKQGQLEQDFEESLKEQKKRLREMGSTLKKEMESMQGEVLVWLKTVKEQEFDLEDGKLCLQQRKQVVKLTKEIVQEAVAETLAKRTNMKENHMVLKLVNEELDQIDSK
jgi:hypothetical protein